MKGLIFILSIIVWVFAAGFGAFTLFNALYVSFHWNDVQVWLYSVILVYFPLLVGSIYTTLKS